MGVVNGCQYRPYEQLRSRPEPARASEAAKSHLSISHRPP